MKKEEVGRKVLMSNALEFIALNKREQKVIKDVLKQDNFTLSGAIKHLRLIARKDLLSKALNECDNALTRYYENYVELLTKLIKSSDCMRIACAYFPSVDGVHAVKKALKVDHVDSAKSYDKTSVAKILPGNLLKMKGFRAQRINYDYTPIVLPVSNEVSTTYYYYVEKERYTYVEVLEAIIAYLNAGCPEIKPDSNPNAAE